MRVAGLALLLALAIVAPAHAAPSLVTLGSFAQPTWAGAPAGEPTRVFVTERVGRVRVIVDGVVQPTPFLDLTAITESAASERGLLSAAFARDYATSGRFYVYLTAKHPVGEIQIWEYTRSSNPNVALPGSGRLLLAIPHTDATNHNGGQVQVGPDGMLWLATGDGGGGNNQYGHAQNPASRLGKLLRLDPAVGAESVELLAQGLRNPWRFSFTPAGEIVIGDVGQSRYEEIDVGLAANYGWPCREGAHAHLSDPGCDGVATRDPFVEQAHGTPSYCSVVGGYVVRDPGLPTLAGRYLYGDYCVAPLRSVDLADARTDAAVGLSVPALSSFGEDACGRVLVVSLNGTVSRLVDGTATPCGGPTPTPTPTATPFATASPDPAPTPAPPAPLRTATDARPCGVTLRVTGLASLATRGYLSIALRTDEACRATVSARIPGVTAFRTATARLVPGTRTVVRLRVTDTRAVARALRSRARTVTVRVATVDAARNARTVTSTVRARRAT